MKKTLELLSALGSLACMGAGLYKGAFAHEWAQGAWFLVIGHGGLIMAKLREMR